MRKYYQFAFTILMILGLLASCSQDEKKYRIGVSQCSDDIWRDKQNSELQIGAYFHDNVELRFLRPTTATSVKSSRLTAWWLPVLTC